MQNDLISRSALKDALKYWTHFPEHRGGKSVYDIIDEAPAANDGFKWVSVEDKKPPEFVSVLGHMTDAGDFPPVRECYKVGNVFFFPALQDIHPIGKWAYMPEVADG